MEEGRPIKLSESQKGLLILQQQKVEKVLMEIGQIGKALIGNHLKDLRRELHIPDTYAFDFKEMAFMPKEGENEKNS